ncbi:MAG: hypothetical protein MKZ53_03385 [Candidatus Thalassarchaeum sp.]|jgi:hypothetical protein|nr:hypothetical protein [Candidatus Thalassarchaeum sp.]|tara:strand:+ start:1511 stop:3403 length:1893 start_codon:yes stop_codon:yes gene_type:complete
MMTGVRRRNLLAITAAVVFVTLISINASAQDRFTIENSADWETRIIDGSTSEPSDNSSAFAGDQIQLSIEVSNSDTTAGHDEWWFMMELDGQTTPELTGFLEGSEPKVIVNISFGPLPEGVLDLIFGIDSTGQSGRLTLLVEPNPLNLTAAGSSEIALIGEPAHVGDSLSASILVHNQGQNPEYVSLELTPYNSDTIQGQPILIYPGSSREVSASFTPSSSGSINLDWKVHSSNGGVARELNGSTIIEVLEPQSTQIVVDSLEWDLFDGLNSEISVYLSDGRSRVVEIEVAIIYQTIETNLQNFEFTMDPGRREINLALGNPSADSLIIRVNSVTWTPAEEIEIQTSLIPPVLDLEISSEGVSTAPQVGESVKIPFSLINNGNTPTLPGEVRIVRNSDRMILDTISTNSVEPERTFSGEFTIEQWPNSKVVDVEIIWLTSGLTESILLEIETYTDTDTEAEFPFDLVAAIYGTVTGLVLVMFILVLYRTVSESVEDTGKSRFNRLRKARGEKKKAAAVEKREIPCPECDQRLNIPSTHSGAVKCPACTARFMVEAIDSEDEESILEEEINQPKTDSSQPKNPQEVIARSMIDLLSCPSCDQSLKVPIERRPVKARCPACRSEFLAEVGES